MSKFEIQPYVGVGNLRFGMTQNEVRKTLNTEFISKKRTEESTIPFDFFPSCNIFAYYKLPGVANGFEFSDEADLKLNGINLFSLSHNKLEQYLSENDDKIEIIKDRETSKIDNLVSKKFGLSAWTPNVDENLPASSILVFEQGYYD